MDYPDSPPRAGEVTVPADASLLDTEDGNYQQDVNRQQDKIQGTSSTPLPSAGKRAREPSNAENSGGEVGSTLPPIYHTVRKLRLNKLVIRNLNGRGNTDTVSTTLGAPISTKEQTGSFLNLSDKRHNHTVHRYDHAHARNISCSFDPSTLICTTCQGGHQVLRRTVEGSDVGMDNPPVFILSDQNFPPMVPAGGRESVLR
jgi:hypothetical protein